MTKLETIVRPFQTRDVFTARVLPPMQPPVAAPEPILFSWGKPIDLLSTAIGVHNLLSGVIDEETDRKTSTVRVTNPDDPDQYVDVERIDKLFTKDELGVARTLILHNT